MKKLNKYIMLFVAAFALVSCVDDVVDTPTAESKAGEDVQFGLSLKSTRTVYGPEASNVFPIYWSDGDKVQIYSPQCAAGRNNAEYKVKPVATESYAEELTKTGDSGVQWGDDESADFYSVYPSSGAVLEGTSDNVTAKLYIDSDQTANYILERDDKGNGVFYAADMDNVVMYAQTKDVNAGEKVNLEYNPYSTVIQFEISATLSGDASIFIDNITLTAPVNISGDFVFSFKDAKVTAGGNNGKVVSMDFGVKPQLTATNSKLVAKLCLMPISGVDNLSGWTVTINGREGDGTVLTKTKKLDAASGALAPGKVHKVILPPISSTKKWEYIPSNWMPQLPEYTNIYLAELSIPGAWYAGAKTDDGYQSTQSISDLWDAGVRAFAVETRCVTTSVNLLVTTYPLATPNNVVVSGTADNAGLVSSKVGTNTLINPDNNANESGSGNAYKDTNDQITVQKIMKDVVACVKAQAQNSDKKPEFAVLILSYSESGKSGMRYVDFGAWLNLIYDAYNGLSADEKSYIYSDPVTANTIVENVLNKVIIKINVDTNIAVGGYVNNPINYVLGTYNDTKTYEYKNNLPGLFSYTPFLSQLDADENVDYTTPLFSKMHWKTWSDSITDYRAYTTTTTNDFLWCFASANRTHADGTGTYEIPTYAQRKTALKAMMEHSDEVYATSNHNVWFYFNVGGIEATDRTTDTSGSSATTYAGKMNDWLRGIIDLKINGGTDTDTGLLVYSNPSPLGIVMFNQCTNATYHGPTIVKSIIEMNNKFKLKRANDPVITDYDATLTTGGNAY